MMAHTARSKVALRVLGSGVLLSRRSRSSTVSDMPTTLITGANKGLGLETARRLLANGHDVWLAARDPDRGRSAANDVGGRFIELDVTSDVSVTRAAEMVEHEVGSLDVLINNAGLTGPLSDAHEYAAADVEAVLATNVVGYVRVIHAFLPLLERSPHPRIVNVSSGLGSFALAHDEDRVEFSAGTPLYSASKAAINMLTVRYARLLPGVRINVADPGMTATDLSGGQGHSVSDGADPIVAFALAGPDGPTGAFRDRDGDLPW